MLQLDTYDNQAPRRIYQKKEGKQSVYDVRWTKDAWFGECDFQVLL
jgi:hypothetical protein